MAVAGKVAITPKGNWSASTAYQKLDLVYYNNGSYVAIQPSTGVTPTNTTYWMLVLQSASEADLEAIISGTTQVGNALTLDGHGAEYFAKETDLADYLPLISSGNKYGTAIDKRGLGAVAVYQKVINDALDGGLVASEGGILGLRDDKNAKWIIGATSDGKVFIDGYNNTPLHTGNKPTGTYTGNGSATIRTVNVGGVGSVLAVYGDGAMCIVTSSGVMGGSNGGSTGNYGAASFANGILTINTDNAMLNKSNTTYTYQVL